MTLWFLILVLLFAIGESQTTNQINQTDLLGAMADMRAKSYHGFVILLKILNGSADLPHSTDITFLMPSDETLSAASLSSDRLNEFILSHSIPTALVFNNLLHFPNGTLVPSGIPGRMLRISNTGRSGMFVNNARIVNSNVCMNSLIKCHGISSAVTFDDDLYFSLNLLNNLHTPKSKAPLNIRARQKSSPSVNMKRISSPH